MMTSRVLVAVCLLSCLTGARSSNPDTVIVEDSSDHTDYVRDQREKAPFPPSESSKGGLILGTQRSQSMVPSFRTMWRKVNPIVYISSSVDTVRDFMPMGTFFHRRKEFQKTRPDFVVPTDKIFTINKEDDGDKAPSGSGEKKSPPKEPELNRSRDEAEAGSVSGDSLRSSNGPKNTPVDSNSGGRNSDRTPTKDEDLGSSDSGRGQNGRPDSFTPSSSTEKGERVSSDVRPKPFDSSSSDGEGRRPQHDRPASFNPPSSSVQGEHGPSADRTSSSSSGQDGRRPSDDRPSSFEPSSPFSGESGKGPSNDRPLSVRPSPSNKPSNGASLNPQDSEGEIFEADAEKSRPPPVQKDDTLSTPEHRLPQDYGLFSGVINDFAFKLVELLDTQENFVVSPLSIFVALSMCYLGSDGVTKSELESTMGLKANAIREKNFHEGMHNLMQEVLSGSREYDLEIANAMFLGRNFIANKDFEDNIQSLYDAKFDNLDFGNQEQALSAINSWVKRATRNMIPSLTDSPLSAMTRLLLVNAVYFKGLWKTQFPEDLTFNGKFTSSDGNTSLVRFMTLYGESLPFFKSDQQRHAFLKLPYEGDQVSMIIALPYRADEKPMPNISDQSLCQVRDALVNTKLDTVVLPKFRLEYNKSLKRPLGRTGLRSLFDPDKTDLSKMTRENNAYVSDVLHKAVIEVSERGTTAAAITGVQLFPLSYRNTTDFLVHHPFAFYVLHEPTGLVLFYGKVYNLEGKGDVFPNNRRQTRRRPTQSSPRKSERVRLHGAVNYEDTNK